MTEPTFFSIQENEQYYKDQLESLSKIHHRLSSSTHQKDDPEEYHYIVFMRLEQMDLIFIFVTGSIELDVEKIKQVNPFPISCELSFRCCKALEAQEKLCILLSHFRYRPGDSWFWLSKDDINWIN